MGNQLIMLLVFMVTLFGLGRSMLILLGLYKEPILHSFEQYGPRERLPMPLMTLLIWAGAFIVTFGVWTAATFGLAFPLTGLGAFFVVVGVAGHYYYDTVQPWYYRVIPYPHWHHNLLARTDRYERRRIAYMWLHLPFRLRLTYGSSDAAFTTWVDFVIMGMTRDEETDIYNEAFYTGR